MDKIVQCQKYYFDNIKYSESPDNKEIHIESARTHWYCIKWNIAVNNIIFSDFWSIYYFWC
jgi:hypothetical protein